MTREELEQNAFWVLGVPLTAPRGEIERAGQKLLSQLVIGAASAKTYQTPFGPRTRDEALVRHALATLRDPERRLLQEFWGAVEEASTDGELPAFHGAMRGIGWTGPR